MAPGTATVETTLFGLLVFGLSWQHLFFRPRGQHKQRHKIIESGMGKSAFQCPGCGTIVIPEPRTARHRARKSGW